MNTFTNEDKRAAVEREIKYRMRVYSRLVVEGKMTTEKSERELGVMQEILEDYQALVEKDRLL